MVGWKDGYEDEALIGWTTVRTVLLVSIAEGDYSRYTAEGVSLLKRRTPKGCYSAAYRHRRKRTKIASDNPSCQVIAMLNGDCLTRNAHMGYVHKTLNIRYGNGASIVVWGRESRLHGEGRQLTAPAQILRRCVRHYEKSSKCAE